MPTLPTRLADRTARWFGRPATVTAVEPCSPRLRRITFTGEALRGKPWTPGHEVEFRVSDRDFRHYTGGFRPHHRPPGDRLLHPSGRSRQPMSCRTRRR